MLAHERAERIVERLRERGTVSAQELVRILQVSAPTIRRDLERLESEGVLRRVHGGAFLAQAAADGTTEAPFAEVVSANAPGKDAVAAAAARLVSPGHVVLLDIGTTTMRIARQLRGHQVTVITGSLAVLDVLRHDESVDLVMLGGSVRRNFHSLVGPLTEDSLASVSADIAFLSCTGVRPDGSVVDDISQEATLKRAMVHSADRVVLAAPASKFPGTGSLRICRVGDLNDIITTADADEVTLEHARQAGANVIMA
jgi:DeoR/GlpR family transcriptional regulator of sugar metabolism